MSEYAKNIQTIEDMWKKRIELRMGRTDGIITELLPCPFCGGEAALVPTLETTVREWFVKCSNLECSVLACRTKRYYTEAEAISAWNTRAERTCRADTCGRTMGNDRA